MIVILGTSGDDVIRTAAAGGSLGGLPDATDGGDSIDAGDGNDSVVAGAGDDTIASTAGADTLDGGGGVNALDFSGAPGGVAMVLAQGDLFDDGFGNSERAYGFTVAFGSLHDDPFFAGSGTGDSLFGQEGNDAIYGNGGDDTMEGGVGDDLVIGEEGADLAIGGDGEDTLVGGRNDNAGFGNELYSDEGEADTLDGGAGQDRLIIGDNDIAIGGEGDDTIGFAAYGNPLDEQPLAVGVAVFSGNMADYDIREAAGMLYVEDLVGSDGMDEVGRGILLAGQGPQVVATLRFADGDLDVLSSPYVSFNEAPQIGGAYFELDAGIGIGSAITVLDYEGDPLTFVGIENGPANGIAGDFAFDPDTGVFSFSYTPDAGFVGFDSFEVLFSDGYQIGRDTIEFDVQFDSAVTDSFHLGVGRTLLATVGDNDADVNGNGPIGFFLDFSPADAAAFAFEDATGAFSLTAGPQPGVLVFSYGADFPDGTTNSAAVVVTVAELDEQLDGTIGDDTILGYGLADTITGGEGSDSIDGGGGQDVVVFGGAIAGYDIVQSGYRVIVQDINPADGDDGADTVDGAETLRFADADYSVTYSYDPLVGVTDARLVNTLGGASGFGEGVLARGDEQHSGPIDVSNLFGGPLDFGGQPITQIYVNTNGNLTFAGPNFASGPDFGGGADYGIIAGFWMNLSTQFGAGTPSPGGNSDGANLVFYDLDPATRTFTATWDDVGASPFGFPSSHAFQIQIVGRDAGDFDIIYRFENNLVGATARAGFANADDSILFELPGSGTSATGDLDQIPGNTGLVGVWQFQIRGGLVAPVALSDAYALDEDQTLTVPAAGILANDSGSGAQPLVARLHGGPAFGTLDLNEDGSFTYTPNANFHGTDSFTYQATEGVAASQPVTVTLAINPVNDAPTSVTLFPAHTPENLVNGQQTGTGISVGTLFATDPESAPGSLTFTLIDDAGGRFALGGSTISTVGELDYETATFHDIQVRVTDPEGAQLDRTLRIFVDNVNEGPTDLVLVGTGAIYENLPPGTLLGRLEGFDGEGDPITYRRIGGPVTVVDDKVYATISFDYEFQTQFSFIVRAEDANGDGLEKQFTIFVDNVNEAPTAVDDDGEVLPGAISYFDVKANDLDPDGDSLLIANFTSPANGLLVLLGNDTFGYEPNPGFFGTDTFTYSVVDPGGLSSQTAIVSLNVRPGEVIAVDDLFFEFEGSGGPLDVLANDFVLLPDGTQVDAATAGLTVSAFSQPANGVVLFSPGGPLTYIPDPDFYGTDHFSYVATDGYSESFISGFVTIDVENVNDDPYQTYIPEFLAVEDEVLYGTLANGTGIASICDPDIYLPADVLGVAPGIYTTAQGGSVILRTDLTFDYTPPVDFKGYDSFDFTYNDFSYDFTVGADVPNGGNHLATVRFLVEGEEPVANDDRYTLTVGQVLIDNVLANDRSPPGRALVEAQQLGGAIAISELGQFNFFAASSGVFSAAYRAVDAAGRVSLDPAILKITVLPETPPGTPFGGAGGNAWGDPHFVTYDRLYYDFQGWGEFVLTRATAGDPFEVQLRTRPWVEGAQVTVIEAAAARIGAHTVQLDVDGTLMVDGAVATLAAGGDPLALSGGVKLWHMSDARYILAAPNGEQVWFEGVGSGSYMNVRPFVAPGRADAMEGILGDFDGSSGNDLQLADGAVLPQQPISSTLLYGAFAAAWRVTDGDSLFTYAPGEGTADFQRPDFPPAPLRLSDLPPAVVAAATAAVEAAGITDPLLKEAAILDLVLTGELGFLDGAAGANLPQAGIEVVIPPPPPLIGLASPAASVAEGDGGTVAVTFTVYRTGSATDEVDVGWAVQAAGLGLADAADFGGALPSGTITLGIGETSAPVTLQVTGDNVAELDETIRVVLTSTPSGHVIASATAQAKIINDDGPVLPQVADDSATTRAGLPVQVAPLANDSDPLGQPLAITGIGDAAHGSLVLEAGRVTYTPHVGFAGNDSFAYTVADARGGTATGVVSITVQPNQPPADISLSSASVDENSPAGTLVGLLSADDPDPGESFTFSLLDDAGGRFAVSGAQLLVAGALDYEVAASHAVTVRVTDAGGQTHDEAFVIAIADVAGVMVTGRAVADRIDANRTPPGQPFVSPEDDTVSGAGGDDTMAGLDGADSLLGGMGNDSLLGGNGDDTLDGGTGADTMRGGAGDDLYRFDNAADLGFEAAGGGADTVAGSVAFVLRNNFEAGILEGDLDLDLRGNGADNTLFGNAGANFLIGYAGADTLDGGEGGDRLRGDGGADLVLGGLGDDTILGGPGADTLDGGAGRDRLIGNEDADLFLFTAIPPGPGEADIIIDFAVGVDRVGILGLAFDASLAPGGLDPSRFLANLNGQAATPGLGTFVFETDNGRLGWDADGAGGGARDLVAILRGGVVLGAGDIQVI